jgi:hypothetical protein
MFLRGRTKTIFGRYSHAERKLSKNGNASLGSFTVIEMDRGSFHFVDGVRSRRQLYLDLPGALHAPY